MPENTLPRPALRLLLAGMLLSCAGGCWAGPNLPNTIGNADVGVDVRDEGPGAVELVSARLGPGADASAVRARIARTGRITTADRVAALHDELTALGPHVDPAEAAAVAETAIFYSAELARRYHMTRPVEFNNVLINTGFKKRGLCYQLADDMVAKLRTMNLKSFYIYRGIAWRDDLWHEHNCCVLTARDHPFETGIAFDLWRHCGNLRWAKVSEDVYPWKQRTPYKYN